jgi:hypothetical protein
LLAFAAPTNPSNGFHSSSSIHSKTNFQRGGMTFRSSITSLLANSHHQDSSEEQQKKNLKLGVLLLNLGGPETLDVSIYSIISIFRMSHSPLCSLISVLCHSLCIFSLSFLSLFPFSLSHTLYFK